MEDISAASAFARAKKNEVRRYPSPDAGGHRLFPSAQPVIRPSFLIKATDSVFAMGPSFAREIETTLRNVDLKVTSRDNLAGPVGATLTRFEAAFNKHNILTILNEIKWALGVEDCPSEKLFYPAIGESHYSELQLGLTNLRFPLSKLISFRTRYLRIIKHIAHADVIFLTLGHVETWYDDELKLYLNNPPSMEQIQREPQRFRFRVLSYEDILDALRNIHGILSEQATKPVRMILTISPEPLQATYRDMDVLLANTYSQSVQRAAVERFVSETEEADYFPALEYVTLSDSPVAWDKNNYREISADLSAQIMSTMVQLYTRQHLSSDPSAMSLDKLKETSQMMMKLKNYQGVLRLAEQRPEDYELNIDLMVHKANALAATKRLDEAIAMFERLVQKAPERPLILERLITLCGMNKDWTLAQNMVETHKTRFPARTVFRDKIQWLDDSPSENKNQE